MRTIILILLTVFSFSYADWTTIDDYKAFNPKWEINPPRDNEIDAFKIDVRGRVKGIGGCGIQANAFYKLAMMLNKDTLQDIINNWQALAFVGALYVVGTYFPILKEAMVGAEMIAGAVARLRNISCDSASKVMSTYLKESSALVRSCVANKLGASTSPFSLDSATLEQLYSSKSEKEIESAYYYCMNNATVFDAFGNNNDMAKWLDKFNFRKKFFCTLTDITGLQDLGDKYIVNRDLFVNGGNAKTMAKLALAVSVPEWLLDSNSRQIRQKLITLDLGGGNSKPLTYSDVPYLLKEQINERIKKIVDYAYQKQMTNYYTEVRKLLADYNLSSSAEQYFDFLYLFITKSQELRATDPIKAERLRAISVNYIDGLKQKFYDFAYQSVLDEQAKMWEKSKKMVEAAKVSGREDDISLYCGGNTQ